MYSLQLPADRPDGGFTGYPWPQGGIIDYNQDHLANTYTVQLLGFPDMNLSEMRQFFIRNLFGFLLFQ